MFPKIWKVFKLFVLTYGTPYKFLMKQFEIDKALDEYAKYRSMDAKEYQLIPDSAASKPYTVVR